MACGSSSSEGGMRRPAGRRISSGSCTIVRTYAVLELVGRGVLVMYCQLGLVVTTVTRCHEVCKPRGRCLYIILVGMAGQNLAQMVVD